MGFHRLVGFPLWLSFSRGWPWVLKARLMWPPSGPGWLGIFEAAVEVTVAVVDVCGCGCG